MGNTKLEDLRGQHIYVEPYALDSQTIADLLDAEVRFDLAEQLPYDSEILMPYRIRFVRGV